MILGAVLAGGRSRRFGSDKAVALLDGTALIDHVIARLRPQVDAIIICGREIAGMTCVPDRPHADLGPLGGLNAALHHAQDHGFAAVVSVPCDAPLLPLDLVARLTREQVAIVTSMPVIGLWPASQADRLDAWIAGDDRSMRGWARLCAAVLLDIAVPSNVNTPADLARMTG